MNKSTFLFMKKVFFFMLLFILVFTSDKKIYQTKKTAIVNLYNSVTSLIFFSCAVCILSYSNIISVTNSYPVTACKTFIIQIKDMTISKANTADS